AGRSDVSPERGGLDPAVDPLPVLGYSELSAGNFPASVPDDIHWWRPGGDLRLALRLRAHRPEHVPDAAARELHDRSRSHARAVWRAVRGERALLRARRAGGAAHVQPA